MPVSSDIPRVVYQISPRGRHASEHGAEGGAAAENVNVNAAPSSISSGPPGDGGNTHSGKQSHNNQNHRQGKFFASSRDPSPSRSASRLAARQQAKAQYRATQQQNSNNNNNNTAAQRGDENAHHHPSYPEDRQHRGHQNQYQGNENNNTSSSRNPSRPPSPFKPTLQPVRQFQGQNQQNQGQQQQQQYQPPQPARPLSPRSPNVPTAPTTPIATSPRDSNVPPVSDVAGNISRLASQTISPRSQARRQQQQLNGRTVPTGASSVGGTPMSVSASVAGGGVGVGVGSNTNTNYASIIPIDAQSIRQSSTSFTAFADQLSTLNSSGNYLTAYDVLLAKTTIEQRQAFAEVLKMKMDNLPTFPESGEGDGLCLVRETERTFGPSLRKLVGSGSSTGNNSKGGGEQDQGGLGNLDTPLAYVEDEQLRNLFAATNKMLASTPSESKGRAVADGSRAWNQQQEQYHGQGNSGYGGDDYHRGPALADDTTPMNGVFSNDMDGGGGEFYDGRFQHPHQQQYQDHQGEYETNAHQQQGGYDDNVYYQGQETYQGQDQQQHQEYKQGNDQDEFNYSRMDDAQQWHQNQQQDRRQPHHPHSSSEQQYAPPHYEGGQGSRGGGGIVPDRFQEDKQNDQHQWQEQNVQGRVGNSSQFGFGHGDATPHQGNLNRQRKQRQRQRQQQQQQQQQYQNHSHQQQKYPQDQGSHYHRTDEEQHQNPYHRHSGVPNDQYSQYNYDPNHLYEDEGGSTYTNYQVEDQHQQQYHEERGRYGGDNGHNVPDGQSVRSKFSKMSKMTGISGNSFVEETYESQSNRRQQLFEEMEHTARVLRSTMNEEVRQSHLRHLKNLREEWNQFKELASPTSTTKSIYGGIKDGDDATTRTAGGRSSKPSTSSTPSRSKKAAKKLWKGEQILLKDPNSAPGGVIPDDKSIGLKSARSMATNAKSVFDDDARSVATAPAARPMGKRTVNVVAPETLPAGFAFEARLGDHVFMATVPEGGVAKGEVFASVINDIDAGADKASVRVRTLIDMAGPQARWRDELFDCFTEGICHPLICNSLFCPQVALTQIMARMQMTSFGERGITLNSRFRVKQSIWLTVGVVFVHIMYAIPVYIRSPQNATLYILSFLPLIAMDLGLLIYFWYLVARTRKAMRDEYDIPQIHCKCCGAEDACMAVCCSSCTVAQMGRHTADYTTYRAMCCTDTGLPNHVEVKLPSDPMNEVM